MRYDPNAIMSIRMVFRRQLVFKAIVSESAIIGQNEKTQTIFASAN
jgi:hypothetical protein